MVPSIHRMSSVDRTLRFHSGWGVGFRLLPPERTPRRFRGVPIADPTRAPGSGKRGGRTRSTNVTGNWTSRRSGIAGNPTFFQSSGSLRGSIGETRCEEAWSEESFSCTRLVLPFPLNSAKKANAFSSGGGFLTVGERFRVRGDGCNRLSFWTFGRWT